MITLSDLYAALCRVRAGEVCAIYDVPAPADVLQRILRLHNRFGWDITYYLQRWALFQQEKARDSARA